MHNSYYSNRKVFFTSTDCHIEYIYRGNYPATFRRWTSEYCPCDFDKRHGLEIFFPVNSNSTYTSTWNLTIEKFWPLRQATTMTLKLSFPCYIVYKLISMRRVQWAVCMQWYILYLNMYIYFIYIWNKLFFLLFAARWFNFRIPGFCFVRGSLLFLTHWCTFVLVDIVFDTEKTRCCLMNIY